jgi:serine/threonine protein kinase
MSPSDTIDELMLRWESARQQGNDPTPEEICADCPQFVDDLRRRIRAVTDMEQVFGLTDLDPLKTMPAPGQHAELGPLPNIPGYEIVRIIDQGGMGIVYEATEIKLGRTVAIKMLPGMRMRPKLVARFRSEAEAMARLQHPNFVQIFAVGEINGQPYYAMEYVAGGSLAELLKTKPPPPRRTAELVETLARAVHAAHERGIVHRDLKPSNIMLTADGNPKIADFGLAKRLDDDSGHTHTGEVLGTPSYMSPEQAEGKKDQIGPATDVYALGAILYELLAGKPPFQGTSPLDSLRQVVAHEPPAPSRFAPSLPRDLEAICLKCLEKAPDHRYPSALDLADDLRCFLAGQPVTARHISPLQRGWKWVRRHPQGVALVSLLVLIAMVPVYLLAENYRAQRQIRLKAEQQAPLVREILHRNCHQCHGADPKNTEKNLDILNHQQLLDSARRIVVPGSPDHSRLMQRIVDGSMPPEEEELRLPRLTEQELEILRDWILGGAPPLPAADPDNLPPPPYSESAAKVKTIFATHCYDCHRYSAAKGGIKILHHRLLVNVRKVVVPGQPEESELFKLVRLPDTDKHCMPPKDYEGVPLDRLPPQDVETIRQWISEGALPFPKGPGSP